MQALAQVQTEIKKKAQANHQKSTRNLVVFVVVFVVVSKPRFVLSKPRFVLSKPRFVLLSPAQAQGGHKKSTRKAQGKHKEKLVVFVVVSKPRFVKS